jgi:microcystin degradation protein MlrC
MRIAIGGISHESLGSSPLTTRLADFQVLRGQEILDAPAHGLRDTARRLEVELVPLLSATDQAPSGTIEQATYLELRDELLDRLRRAGPLDGVCLLLHGATLVQHIWSGDTDLVREVRASVGRDVPIAVRLDLHANLNEEFANAADIWTGFRTAPHRDAQQTLERSLALLAGAIRSGSRPRAAFVRVPLLLQGEKATTGVEPMRSHMAMARAIEREPGILNAEVFVGFGWADSPQAGSSVAVIARDEAHLPAARRHALELAQAMWDRRDEFSFDQEVAESVDAAIELGLAASQSSVFLTDSGDNPTAGTPGDSTYFLSRLIAHQVPDAILAGIPDAEATRVCFQAGEGAQVSVSLGGKWDRLQTGPLELSGVVEHLYPGDVAAGDSPMATLRVGGVHVIITGLRRVFATLDAFRDAGLDTLAHKLVVVKLGYLLPALRDAAPREIMALSPGYSDMQLERLAFRYLTRPIFPLDRDFSWQARVSNVAGFGDPG